MNDFMTQIVNFDVRTRLAFAVERNAPFRGYSAYNETTWVALFENDDDQVRVDVYNEDGETLFSQVLNDLPVRVANAWVLEAMGVTA